ncbi:DUF6973 domain-containing protein [Yinghuangia soli]|uniref:DUF6973 domain-containing protein n=1 Tax=Yinghuangia soli TaxID=2908204 RepID=A0AA41TZ03_9ACTN|nr:hypothetical protein [Yinghuangia soli]MCF2528328.1 hypothetical protein [Yinghuangia soli]
MADVQEIVPGDPVGLRALADKAFMEAVQSGYAGQHLTAVQQSTAAWQGTSAAGFRESLTAAQRRLDDIMAQVGHFTQTLNDYAQGIEGAQRSAYECLDIAARLGAPWQTVQKAAFDAAVMETIPPGKGPASEAELRYRAEQVEQFFTVFNQAKIAALAAENAFMNAMKLPPSEIAESYQVPDDPRQSEAYEGTLFEEHLLPGADVKRPGTEQDMFTKLSTQDQIVFQIIANKAWEECRNRFPDQGELDGHADAFRHTYWNVMLSRYFGNEWAEKYTTAHELTADKNPGIQTAESMDLYNNQVGRSIAIESKGVPYDDLADKVEAAVRSGRTVVMDGNGNLQYSDQVAPGQTYLPDREPVTKSYDPPRDIWLPNT